MSEDLEAEIQMAFVRVCRHARNANSVWFNMKKIFPEHNIDDIKKAVQPVIKSMSESLTD